MGDVHIIMTFGRERLLCRRVVVAHEPRQSDAVPSHILLLSEVSRTIGRCAVVVLCERHRLRYLVHGLRIHILCHVVGIALRRETVGAVGGRFVEHTRVGIHSLVIVERCPVSGLRVIECRVPCRSPYPVIRVSLSGSGGAQCQHTRGSIGRNAHTVGGRRASQIVHRIRHAHHRALVAHRALQSHIAHIDVVAVAIERSPLLHEQVGRAKGRTRGLCHDAVLVGSSGILFHHEVLALHDVDHRSRVRIVAGQIAVSIGRGTLYILVYAPCLEGTAVYLAGRTYSTEQTEVAEQVAVGVVVDKLRQRGHTCYRVGGSTLVDVLRLLRELIVEVLVRHLIVIA